MSCCSSCKQEPCLCKFSDPVKLVGCALIPSLTPTVDALRDIQTALGARQYLVTLFWQRWSGGERGSGYADVIKTYRLMPTPLVSSLTALDVPLEQIGPVETGDVRVTEISPRFSEQLLMGNDLVVPTGQPLPPDISFFWMITYLPSKVSRRFTISRAPSFDALKFQWEVVLMRQDDGVPKGVF